MSAATDACARLRAERDQARAQVEAVRALAEHWEQISRLDGFGEDFRFHMAERAEDLRAALDGAP